MSKFFLKLFIFLLIIFQYNYSFSLENKILFKILNKSFTSIDFDKRNKYLQFVGDNSELSNDEILEDFISVNLFNESYLNSNIRYELTNEINKIYDQIIISNKNNNKFIENDDFKKNIIENLKLDLIRKKIIQTYLESKREDIFNKEDELNLLYNFKIKYINVFIADIIIYRDILEKMNFKSLSELESFLNQEKINYYINEKEIQNIQNIDENIKKNILTKNNFFMIENNDFLSLIFIKKELKTYEGLIANIFSFDNVEKIERSNIKCKNINKNNFENFISKEYEYYKLNNQIKNNLIEIDDYIEISNDGTYKYIVLCGIKFNREIINNYNINKKINSIVNKIEKELINNYSKTYNLVINNE